jgi:3-hydroxyacyl-[acyl-carrier-protein] dehydratase
VTELLASSAATGQLIALDRVTALEPGRRAVAIRNVPNTLSIFDSHFPRFPVLPGVLILGSLAQLAALLLAEDTATTWRLAAAETIRYRHFVQPGDQMELTVELKERTAEQAVCAGTVRVDGKPVTTVRRLRMAPLPTGGGA